MQLIHLNYSEFTIFDTINSKAISHLTIFNINNLYIEIISIHIK